MRKEVDVAGTVAAAERSEAAPEGGPGVLPRKFLKSRLQMLMAGSRPRRHTSGALEMSRRDCAGVP